MTQGAAMRSQRCQKGQRAPAAVRHLGNEPGAARCAAVAPGHIGLGPSLVDENQTPGVNPALILLPLGATIGDVGAVLLAGVEAFFEADPLALEEAPHRPVAGRRATFGQFGDQAAQRQVRLLGDPRQQPFPLRQQHQLLPAAHPLGRRAAGRPPALRPLHHAGDTDAKQRRRRTARPARRHRADNPVPQVL